MRADDFTNSASGGGAGIDRCFHSANFAAHDRGDQARVDLFPADQPTGSFRSRPAELSS